MLLTRMMEADAGELLPGKQLFSDNFDRADSATSLGNSAWTVVSGTWGITGNRAYCVTHPSGVQQLVLSTASMARKNYLVTAKIPTVSTNESPGIVARATDANNFYMVHNQSGGSTLVLFMCTSGTFATKWTSPASTFAAGDTFGLQCIGSAISVVHNGTVLHTLTDASFAGPGMVGMRYGMSGASSFTATWDNFTVVTA